MSTYQVARDSAVWWRESLQGLIELKGPDAGSYLQTQLTQDILSLEPAQALPAALVERKARLRSLMLALRLDPQTYWLLPEAGAEVLCEHLEQFHFIENFELQEQSDWVRLRLAGPLSWPLLRQLSGQPLLDTRPFKLQSLVFAGGSAWMISEPFSGEDGVRLIVREAYLPALLAHFEDLGLLELSAADYESLRLEAGLPLFGLDMDQSTLLPETGLEKETVSYDKGCYLGQEVIARIHSYGVVPRALMGLSFEQQPPGPGEIFVSERQKPIGQLTSFGFSPQLQRWIGLAMLKKDYRQGGLRLELELLGQTLSAQVTRLPFYTPPSAQEQAQTLLHQGLEVFANGEESQAIPLLQAAISKDPLLADAYESLGVILSRLGQQQEAIEVMKQLAVVAPEEAMAHTNLSRFYMLLGDKATAELHMAEATRLNMLRTQKEMQHKALLEQEQQQKLELMEMFKEVLESEDPDDLVANFGLGKALVDLGQAEEALPYLSKATEVDPLYSAAWLQLGKALELTGNLQQAYKVYSSGMEAAAEKGDLMPLKEMEQRRAGLKV